MVNPYFAQIGHSRVPKENEMILKNSETRDFSVFNGIRRLHTVQAIHI